MNNDTHERDSSAQDKSAESGQKRQRDSTTGKIPARDQHTPGEEGDKSGGGLQGA